MATRLRRHLPALGLILAIALVLRLIWVLSVHPNPIDGRFDDTAWYRSAAHYFANGDGYVNPFTGTPTAAWPPGYPVALGLVFARFGEGLAQTFAFNIILSLATIVLVYCIGLRLLDQRSALIGAGAMAVWPGQVYFSSLTLSEPLFTFLFVLGVLLIVLVPDAGRWRGPMLLALGAVVAAAALTRGQAVLLLPLALIGWGLAGYRWRPALLWLSLSAVVTAALLAPWVARNQRQLGSPVLIATNFGPNLWIGNHEGASGRMATTEPAPPQPERGTLTQPEYEVEADQLAFREAWSYMLRHPREELRLSAIKTRATYESDATALDWNAAYRPGFYITDSVEEWLRGAANGFWYAVLAFATLGLISIRGRLLRDMSGILPAMILMWTAGHIVFFGDSRFHYPIAFCFALLGARGLLVLFETVRRPQPSLDGPDTGRYATA